jgi:hypothetical protein
MFGWGLSKVVSEFLNYIIMKKLSLNQTSAIEGGGGATEFFDGFCTGVAIYALFGPVGWALGGGCTIYGVVRIIQD